MNVKIRNILYVVSVRVWICLLVCSITGQTMFGQTNVTVRGNVADNTGETLVGVSIHIKNTTIGTVTDVAGNYMLTVPSDAVLVFSSVGMETQEVQVLGRTTINVEMRESALAMEEVVVTAFSTQKKVNVTGSISVVSGNEILATPVSNISNALVGISPGVSAIQTSGEPGRNAADITIRGVATYNGNTAPLIVIDGIEQASEQAYAAFNNLDPNDILGISLLKDASSTAVYGIRAANGVIIVTTKRGNVGKPKVSVSTNFGITKATTLQKGISSYEWAMLRNEGVRNEMNSFPGTASYAMRLYDERDLWKFENNRDFDEKDLSSSQMAHLSEAQKNLLRNSPALYYGSHDLYVEQFNRLGPQFQANVNISGGTDRVKYYTSLGYFSQESITNATSYYGSNTGSKFSRYNYRANVDVDVIKNTTISVNLFGQFGTTQGPGIDSGPYDLSGRYKVIMQYIYDANPFWCGPGISDNHLISGFDIQPNTVQQALDQKTGSSIGNQNPVQSLLTSGTGYIYNTLLNNTIRIKHVMPYFLRGLSVQASVDYQDNYNRYVTRRPSLPTYTVRRSPNDPNILEYFGGSMGGDSFGSSGQSNWNKLYIDAGIYYDGSFRGHNLGLLFLGKASRYTMPSDSNNTPSGIMGLVGRITYDYNQRYLVEFNMGYNGTEQFIKGKRFGFFPAFSAGWVPTNEAFFPKTEWVSFLKIRGTYGVVGNDGLGSRRYLYLPNTYNLNQGGYYWGDATNVANPQFMGVTEGTLGNPNVTWEKSEKYDVGFEARLFNNKLSFTFDWFNEDRSNILTNLGIIPIIYGVSTGSVPPANVGKTNNKGYDVVLGWKERRGNFGYNIEGYMSYASNKVIYRAEAPNPYPWMNETGHKIGQRFGLVSDGLYNTLEELNSRPYNTFTSNRATLGDIKFRDLDGDGIIDNKDRAPIGYPNRAEYQFGLKLGFDYKGFDVRMLFIGTAHGSFYITPGMSMPFYKMSGNAFKWQYDGRWTEEKYKNGEKITYPRAPFDPVTTDNNYLQNSYWMRSSDFFKLKNMEIGYTFPKSMRFIQAAGISSLRAYANGNNLYTFINKMREMGIDPETKDNATYIFPLTLTVTFGINIQF